jgi:hypothetical protein
VNTPGICAIVVSGCPALRKEIRRELCEEINADEEDSVAWAQFSNNPSATNRWVDIIPMITGEVDEEAYSQLNETLDLKNNDVIFVGVQPSIFTVLLDMIVIDDRAVQLC